MICKRIVWGWHKKRSSDTLYLSSKDVNHLERVYEKYNLEHESIDEVVIEFLCDRNSLIRYIIKELDILLKPGGQFKIVSTFSTTAGLFVRSDDQIMYEFSVSTNGRYCLLDRQIKGSCQTLKYQKQESVLPHSDTIDKWSFGIISNGTRNKQVRKIIRSIANQNIPNYEVLVCGPTPYENEKDKLEHVKILDDVDITPDIRAPISRKKNKIISEAQNLI